MIRRRGQPRRASQRRTPDCWLWPGVSMDQAAKKRPNVRYRSFRCLRDGLGSRELVTRVVDREELLRNCKNGTFENVVVERA